MFPMRRRRQHCDGSEHLGPETTNAEMELFSTEDKTRQECPSLSYNSIKTNKVHLKNSRGALGSEAREEEEGKHLRGLVYVDMLFSNAKIKSNNNRSKQDCTSAALISFFQKLF